MISIRAVGGDEPRTVEACRHLLNELLGDNLYPPAKMADIAADDEALLSSAGDVGIVVGAAVARLLYAHDADYYRAFGARPLELFARFRVGSLEALAVTPAYQRKGIGARMTLEQMAWLAENGREVAVAVAWISGGTSPSAPMYASLGFESTPVVPEFYYRESVADGWTCPYCKGPCHCAAAMYYRQLK